MRLVLGLMCNAAAEGLLDKRLMTYSIKGDGGFIFKPANMPASWWTALTQANVPIS